MHTTFSRKRSLFPGWTSLTTFSARRNRYAEKAINRSHLHCARIRSQSLIFSDAVSSGDFCLKSTCESSSNSANLIAKQNGFSRFYRRKHRIAVVAGRQRLSVFTSSFYITRNRFLSFHRLNEKLLSIAVEVFSHFKFNVSREET